MIDKSVLVFGTMYVNNEIKLLLLKNWLKLIAPQGYDTLLVDSQSYMTLLRLVHFPKNVKYISFPDNIGHLNLTGRDGWGRAWDFGVQYAINNGYKYVVHIESDILFSPWIEPIIQRMKMNGERVLSTKCQPYSNYLETGIMFMDVDFVREFELLKKYDWQSKKQDETPELILNDMLSPNGLVYTEQWKGCRYSEMPEKPDVKTLDYITHCGTDEIKIFMEER